MFQMYMKETFKHTFTCMMLSLLCNKINKIVDDTVGVVVFLKYSCI